MGSKVTVSEIRMHIWAVRREQIVAEIAGGRRTLAYPLKEFRRDMNVDDFLVDARTIRSKWDSLVDAGIIEEEYPCRACPVNGRLLFAAFRDVLPRNSRMLLERSLKGAELDARITEEALR